MLRFKFLQADCCSTQVHETLWLAYPLEVKRTSMRMMANSSFSSHDEVQMLGHYKVMLGKRGSGV